MARASWNVHSPDVVGIEFIGIGVANHIIQTTAQSRALRFKPQRSGEVDQIAIYSGAATSNPLLSGTNFPGHRKPWIIDLIPVSGFDVGGPKTSTSFLSNITSSTSVVDEVGTAVDGDELEAANDGLFLVTTDPATSAATVEMPGCALFGLDRHVTAMTIECSFLRPMNVRRIDQNGSVLWIRQLLNNWTMGEAYIEAGDTATWRQWSPTDVRQFSVAGGNRRLRAIAASAQPNIMDLLRLRVDHIPERRAGTAVFEPPGAFQWISIPFHAPNATGTPATVVAGQEYVLLVRVPGGDTDYASSASYDFRAVRDRRPASTFIHFPDLDWDVYGVSMWDTVAPRGLQTLLDGLPAVRICNDGLQTVDTQPYQETVGVVPVKQASLTTRATQRLDVPPGTTSYGRIRMNVACLIGAINAPPVIEPVNVRLVNNIGSIIAGPVQITREIWEDSPVAGNDIFNDPYRTVTLDFTPSVDINEANGCIVEFLLDDAYQPGTNNVWRIGALIADIFPVTGSDQTFAVSGTGVAATPPTNAFLDIASPNVRRGDLLVSILSSPPAITGIGVTGLSQPVTGGVCDPCSVNTVSPCAVGSIPYNHVCWSKTTVTKDKFAAYEIQRQETALSSEWITIGVISATGVGATGVPATGVDNCFDDYSHVYDSQVCYRVRQHRFDGTFSDFVETTCITTASPEGADLIITAPEDPTLNVAFPEAHSSLPIQHEWTNLDAGQLTHRAIYGRDKFLAFRPLEKLGLRFQRDILIAALCTPETPCLSVTDGLKNIASAPVAFLVVRDRCGNRWYSTVAIPTLTQLHDPTLGDIWLAAIEVTELATPVITVDV